MPATTRRNIQSLLWIPALSGLLGCSREEAVPIRELNLGSAEVVTAAEDAFELTCALELPGRPLRANSGVSPGQVFDARLLSDGGVALLDAATRRLQIFDELGAERYVSGLPGDGPGELRTPWAVTEGDSGRIWIVDFAPWRLVARHATGEALSETNLSPLRTFPPVHVALLADGSTALTSLVPAPGRRAEIYDQQLHIVRYSSSGVLRDTFAVIASGRAVRTRAPVARDLSPMFESQAMVAGGGSTLVIAHGARPEYVSIVDGGSGEAHTRITRWLAPRLPVTRAHVSAERERLRASTDDVPAELRADILEPLLGEDRPVADVIPFLDDIRVASGGGVIVREPAQRSDGTPRALLFNARGVPRCALDMPPGIRLLDWIDDTALLEVPAQDGDVLIEIARIRPRP